MELFLHLFIASLLLSPSTAQLATSPTDDGTVAAATPDLTDTTPPSLPVSPLTPPDSTDTTPPSLPVSPLTPPDSTDTTPPSLPLTPSAAPGAAASGTIERATKQQVIATIAPKSPENSQLFLASPSGKYAAYFLRVETVPGAGGFGSDFCYIQIKDSSNEESVWESECTPVSTANACSLVFAEDGLAVFDGSNSLWDTSAESADNNPLETVELVDEGDMRIRDKLGELAWKASQDPRNNQNCGRPGSPGLAPVLPPFAQPIGGGANLPFGQQQQQPAAGGQQQTSAAYSQEQKPGSGGASQAFGFGSQQPLVDNNPYDSGAGRGVGLWFGLGLGLVLTWVANGVVF